MMNYANSIAQDGKAHTVKKTFSTQTSVSITIDSEASVVWKLLTTASDFTRWNSTVTMLEGEIALKEKIRLMSILDEKRVFKIKIKEMVPEKYMVWGDAQGNRVFEIKPLENGQLLFSMTEKIGGLMYPMYAKYLPPFDETFEQFARDLKNEAESIRNVK